MSVSAVFGERANAHSDLVEQVDDRPYHFGGGRD